MAALSVLPRALLAAALLLLPAGGAGTAPQPIVRIAYAGDVALAEMPGGGAGFFSAVRGALRGDVVLGNLEGTLAGGGSPRCQADRRRCFVFRAPPSYAVLLAGAGFTVLNLANNHFGDFGPAGQRETLSALDGAGLDHTGRPGEIAFERAGPLRVAVVGFAPFRFAQSLRDLAAAAALIRAASAGADVVVVTMHAGAEGAAYAHVRPGDELFLGENRGDTVAFAHAAIDAGADLVVGSGPHVLRGLEWYRGRLIAYSLGDFAGYHTLDTSGVDALSGILRVELRRDGSWAGGRLVPVRLAAPGTPRLDPGGDSLDFVRSLSLEDFGPRAVGIAPDGRLLPPAR